MCLCCLHTGKIWFAQKIPIMVPTEGMCVHTCNNTCNVLKYLLHTQYFSTPESQSLVVDMIRYLCCVIHPTNEVLCSDIIPRWLLIGWLLSLCTVRYWYLYVHLLSSMYPLLNGQLAELSTILDIFCWCSQYHKHGWRVGSGGNHEVVGKG